MIHSVLTRHCNIAKSRKRDIKMVYVVSVRHKNTMNKKNKVVHGAEFC